MTPGMLSQVLLSWSRRAWTLPSQSPGHQHVTTLGGEWRSSRRKLGRPHQAMAKRYCLRGLGVPGIATRFEVHDRKVVLSSERPEPVVRLPRMGWTNVVTRRHRSLRANEGVVVLGDEDPVLQNPRGIPRSAKSGAAEPEGWSEEREGWSEERDRAREAD